MTVKELKTEANYTNTTTNTKERCGLCLHFVPPSECNRVVGIINRGGWCKYFVHRLK